MATINFPDTTGQPTDGSFTYEFDGIVYEWDGEKWTSQGSSSSGGGGGGGSVDLSGLVKLNDGGSIQEITGGGGLSLDGQLKLPGGATFNNEVLTKKETEDLIAASGGGGGGGNVTVNLAWRADGNNDAQILNSAGQDATVPIVRNTVAGLMTGDQKQTLEAINGSYLTSINLTYVDGGNKDAPGKVKANTGGSDATIPIATDSKAGLISGTLHQKLGGLDLSQYLVDNDNVSRLTNDVQYLRDGNRDKVSSLINDANYVTDTVLDGITAQDPLTITTSKQLRLKYSKGLNLVSNNLEVDVGRGLVYNGNEIEADIPEQAVSSFSPIVVIASLPQTLNCKRGEQFGTPMTGTFVFPDGASQFSLVFRAKATLTVVSSGNDGTVSILWCQNIGWRIGFDSGVYNPNTGGNDDSTVLDGLSIQTPQPDRRQSGFCTRLNDFYVPGTGDRTITYTATPRVLDSSSDHNGIIGNMNFGSVNMLLIPMTNTP